MAFLVNSCVKRLFRRKHFILTSVVISSLLFIALVTNQSRKVEPKPAAANLPIRATPPVFVAPMRLVHIDLKGAPPKLEYFSRLLPLLSSLGGNGLLLEYEDMFPFSGLLATARANNAYSEEEVRALLKMAADNGLEVIPLVQTFGHLEFVLKLKEFQNLRESRDLPQALCPSNNQSFHLIQEMVDQVLALHPKSRFLHIGCDEVFHIGLCDLCRQRERDQLFLNHVHRIGDYVIRRHSVVPIVWDDMLRQIPIQTIRESGIHRLVEPMIWTYIKDIYRFISFQQFQAFSQLFPNLWTASAFKGAFGETLTVPNIRMHLDNNMAWNDVMREQNPNFRQIRGIVITGWSRYDHLAVLCELLPAALPSLAINLLVVSAGGNPEAKDIFARFDHVMQCREERGHESDQWSVLDMDPFLFERSGNCIFPGSSIFRLMQTHGDVIKRVDDYLYDVTVHKAWLTDYNVRHNMTSPFRVDEGLQDFAQIQYGVQSLMRSAKRALTEVYDEFTVAEWIEQNVLPSLLKMEKLMNDSMALKKASLWPRRPLPVLEDIRRRLATDQTPNNFIY